MQWKIKTYLTMELRENFEIEKSLVYEYLTDKAGMESEIANKVIEKIGTAPGGMNESSGVAYPGGLIHYILKTLKHAENEARMYTKGGSDTLKSILKVCVLMHLSKPDMYEENPDEWEVKKRGMVYRFVECDNRLKFGQRSYMECVKLGIELTPVEVEAMYVMDRKSDPTNNDVYDSFVSMIVRHANEAETSIELQLQKRKQ